MNEWTAYQAYTRATNGNGAMNFAVPATIRSNPITMRKNAVRTCARLTLFMTHLWLQKGLGNQSSRTRRARDQTFFRDLFTYSLN